MLNTSIDDNGNAIAITIDSSERVLIGTDSGDSFNSDSMLRLQRTGDRVFMQFKTDADQNSGILFGDVDDDVECAIEYEPANQALTLSTGNNVEAIRVNSTGDFLVRQTDANVYDTNTGGTVRQYWGNQFSAQNNTNSKVIIGSGSAIGLIGGATTNSASKFIVNSYMAFGQATATAGSEAGYIDFYTSTGGAAGAQRMRILSGGGLSVGGTTCVYTLEVHGTSILRGATYTQGAAMPLTDNYFDLGHPSYRWDDVRATNGTIQTSDRNDKNTIIDSDLGLDFIKRLAPKSYKFNDGTRTHYGLIAQDVETILSDISKPTADFAGFIKDEPQDAPEHEENPVTETRYGLRYTEFIAPMIKAIQEQQEQIESLQQEIEVLKNG